MWQKHLRAIKHPNWAIATAIPGIIFVVGCSTIVCLLIERESILNRFLSAAQSRAAILKAKSSLTPSEISEIISISLSTQAGRMLYRRSSLPKKYSGNAGLVPINFRRHQLNCSLSMRPQRNSAQAASSRTLGRSLQALSSTPPTSSSVISGCVLDWCRETAAWSVLSSPQDRLRKSPITS